MDSLAVAGADGAAGFSTGSVATWIAGVLGLAGVASAGVKGSGGGSVIAPDATAWVGKPSPTGKAIAYGPFAVD